MLSYRTETIISQDRVLTVRGVPFRPGEKVEVIILSHPSRKSEEKRCSLRGKPIRYVRPFDSVAENEWQALR
ncbi:MAG: hypothetical protein HY673_14530 [Chloroflexi bacterium]|nr:hypothetical protein [Chloroflexota bacterium]